MENIVLRLCQFFFLLRGIPPVPKIVDFFPCQYYKTPKERSLTCLSKSNTNT